MIKLRDSSYYVNNIFIDDKNIDNILNFFMVLCLKVYLNFKYFYNRELLLFLFS